ncbi:MAG: hypothetical protein ACRDRJ_00615 [Streptosporangiaceae bacterium]
MFRHLVLARIIEPSSKLDSLRVLEEAGVAPASDRTLKRRLPAVHQAAHPRGRDRQRPGRAQAVQAQAELQLPGPRSAAAPPPSAPPASSCADPRCSI